MSKVRFRTNALLKSIIGKDLITDDNIAVLELVKNSFDAGSPTVEIVFNNVIKNDDNPKIKIPSKNSSMLIIRDEGSGMSESDVSDKWLNIAYSEKKMKREEYGRVLAGNKGVGRFSCDRLGRFLTLYSKQKGQYYNKLFIDWKLFEKEGLINFNIQDVELEIHSLSEDQFVAETGYRKLESGTILEISSLRESWNAKKIISLKRQLERLINPNQAFKKGSFGVKIIANEFREHDKDQEDYNKINTTVKNRIFETLDFKTSSIQSNIDAKGEIITTTLQDRGNIIFTLKERNKFSQLANVHISIFYLSTYAKAYFSRQTGIKSVDFGSIFLFINGFRIPPYGNDGDDWLGMENRKAQGYSRFLGTREVVGRIEVNDDSERFKIISNRSGVVNNSAFEQLTKDSTPFGYYYKTFRRLERFVVEGIKWDSTPVDSSIIEKEVNSKKWNESKEIYYESALDRNKRILQVIKKISDSKKEEILDLQINEDFVKQIINEQIEKAKSDLENVISTVAEKSKGINPELIGDVLGKLSKNSQEIESFVDILTRYSDGPDIDVKALGDIQKTLQLKYAELAETKDRIEERLKIEENARIEAENERKRIEEELALEREKNTFLRATSKGPSEDARGLIHNIKNTSKNIGVSVDQLMSKIKAGNYKPADLYEKLHTIKFNNEKVLKIAKLITRANFKTNENSQVLDVVKYVEQYLQIYNDIFDNEDLKITCVTKNATFIKRLSALEISLIFDDLVSNSRKAGAKNVLVAFESSIPTELVVLVSDDGVGVDSKFSANPKSMFELGVSSGTHDGSGIGLHSVRKALKSMQGEIIFKGNNVVLHGATFQIVIRK